MSEKPKLKSLLLVASKNPVAGNVKTRLSPPLTLEDSALLYSCFLQDLVERLLKLKNVKITVSYSEKNASDLQNLQKILPYKQLSFEKQNGESLGEKLKNCFEFYFSQGFEKIAVIGSDSPDLPLEFVEKAFEVLETKNAVIGPTEDGGYYLVGLSKPETKIFQEITWSTEKVFAETLQKFHDLSLTFAVLPLWFDVDDFVSLEKFAKRLTPKLCKKTEKFIVLRRLLP